MHRTLLLLASATLLLPACVVSEEDKASELSSAWCSRYKECRADGFNKNWDSPGQCENKESNLWLGKLSSIDSETQLSCTLDEKAVQICADALTAMDCGEFSDKAWESDCSTVLLCSQGLSADW